MGESRLTVSGDTEGCFLSYIAGSEYQNLFVKKL